MKLDVHLIRGGLHMLKVLGALDEQILSKTVDRTRRTDS
jgi:hypothetical protein